MWKIVSHRFERLRAERLWAEPKTWFRLSSMSGPLILHGIVEASGELGNEPEVGLISVGEELQS